MRLDGQNPPDKPLLETTGKKVNSIQQWNLRTVDRRGSPPSGKRAGFCSQRLSIGSYIRHCLPVALGCPAIGKLVPVADDSDLVARSPNLADTSPSRANEVQYSSHSIRPGCLESSEANGLLLLRSWWMQF